MKMLKVIGALGLGLMLAACGATPELATRKAPLEGPAAKLALGQPSLSASSAPTASTIPSYRVVMAGINVPRTLKVNESESYYPRGDIVWRGDPIGDRYVQIEDIFEAAVAKGVGDVEGEVPVIIDIQVLRFHSLSDRARFSVGGVHNMPFRMRVRHAQTGKVLMPSREVEADLDAFGGADAFRAEQQGQTQKVRVTDFLAHKIRHEMTTLTGQVAQTRVTRLRQIQN